MSFPVDPAVDDEVEVAGVRYRFDGDGWRRVVAAGGANPLDWVNGGTAVVLDVVFYEPDDFHVALMQIEVV